MKNKCIRNVLKSGNVLLKIKKKSFHDERLERKLISLSDINIDVSEIPNFILGKESYYVCQSVGLAIV